ncbi:MAG: DUF4265 domain-containing protein [Planctomycetes bacterium]|nr:DUF4265 domain-containing protein [Planctomycetota bacterium]
MDNLAWHYNPVQASDFFIRVDLSTHGMPGRFEQLWAKQENDRVFRICCVPFFTYGIALGDTVETDDAFTFQRIVSKGGYKVLRIAVVNRTNETHLHSMLHGWVEQSGLPYEWYCDGYLSVDLPPDAVDVKNMNILDELDQDGEISFEIVE